MHVDQKIYFPKPSDSFSIGMTDDDIKKAKRMTFRLYALGERNGSRLSGELAQLLVGNVFFQNDKTSNLINLCLGGSDEKVTIAPLSKSIRLFMQAREEIPRPFVGRSDCLQSTILDVLLCYISFWGQVFEYYETMYYKPVSLPDGQLEQSPANVCFEVGWSITCLFIRDMMLSAAARSAGVASGYDRSMSWLYYPANAVGELEEAKSLVLTVIGKIRKRGTVLVAAEGTLGHISFGNAIPLTHWIEDNLDKDWNNTSRLESLCHEYFETTSIRLSVSVTNTTVDEDSSPLNASFGGDISFLDGFERDSNECPPMLSVSSRSIAVNIRPITPVVFGSPNCDWSGIDMLEFCRSVVDQCVWPEVVNTVSTMGEIGISVLNVVASVAARTTPVWSPVKQPPVSALMPFPTPSDVPALEPFYRTISPVPTFGTTPYIPIPNFTPTPKHRDSNVTFYNGEDEEKEIEISPIMGPLAEVFEPIVPPPVSSAPCAPPSKPQLPPCSLSEAVASISAAANASVSQKNWSAEKAIGALKSPKNLEDMSNFVNECGQYENAANLANAKRRRSSALFETSSRLESLLSIAYKSEALRRLSVHGLVGSLARILALAVVQTGADLHLESIVAIASDFACFVSGVTPHIPPSDICATGLRGACAAGGIALFEVAKELQICDWFSLATFYNDVGFMVFMGPSGLLAGAPKRLNLSDHCLLVGTELMMRWAWSSESRLWEIHHRLLCEFSTRRHAKHSSAKHSSAELNYFLKLALMNCALYLCDIADRLGVKPMIVHCAFDLIRSTILLKPAIMQGRHLYQLVFASLMASDSIFSPPPHNVVTFERMHQAALIRENSKTAQILVNKYVFKSVSLSVVAGGTATWANGSGPLVLPNGMGFVPPELGMLGDVAAFYEQIFLPEMRQVVFNLGMIPQVTGHEELRASGAGPFVQAIKHSSSLSPGAFLALSSAFGIALQIQTQKSDLQYAQLPYSCFEKAMPLVSPFGVVPCLLPPMVPAPKEPGRVVYKWFTDAALVQSPNGGYTVVETAELH